MNPKDDERGIHGVAGGNKFAFATIVRKRAIDLGYGAQPRVYTKAGNAVSVAIAETAVGELELHTPRATPVERGPVRSIVCSECRATVNVRRRPDAAPQGRPPSKCSVHGLSANWIQVDYVERGAA